MIRHLRVWVRWMVITAKRVPTGVRSLFHVSAGHRPLCHGDPIYEGPFLDTWVCNRCGYTCTDVHYVTQGFEHQEEEISHA